MKSVNDLPEGRSVAFGAKAERWKGSIETHAEREAGGQKAFFLNRISNGAQVVGAITNNSDFVDL